MSASADEQPRRRGLLSSTVASAWSYVTGADIKDERDRVNTVWGIDDAGKRTREYQTPRAPEPTKTPSEPTAATTKASEPVVERIYLQVPFEQKDEVKSAGARWDKKKKAWFVTSDRDSAAFAKWLPKEPEPTQEQPQSAAQETGKRRYLDVPYEEKDAAKAAGAQWDKERKAWFAPPGSNLETFEQWMPGRRRVVDPVEQFAEVLRKAGLQVDEPQMDGRLHRVPVEGDRGREKSGAYAGWLDGRPSGFIQNFKTGEKAKWTVEREPKSIQALREEKTMERDKQVQQEHERAAGVAREVWNGAASAEPDHPYLARKGIDGQGLRVGAPGQSIKVSDGKGGKRPMDIERWLVVPVSGPSGELASLQFISPDPKGGKVFLPGGEMKGGYYAMGDFAADLPILVAEGVATGKTLNATTGLPVVVAFNAGNMSEVATGWQAANPEAAIFLAGDNDHRKEAEGKPNVGKLQAEEAAAAIGSVAIIPPFQPHEMGSDWNDLASLRGAATTRSIVLAQLRQAEPEREALQAGAGPFERARPRARQHEAAEEMER